MWPVFFAEQLERDHALNERWLTFLEDREDDLTDELRLLASELINSHHIWNSRLQGAHPESAINDVLPVHHWKKLLQANFRETRQFLDDFSTEEKIRYHDSEGVQLEALPANMLFALLQSNQFYRAQLEYVCRQAGWKVTVMQVGGL